jgi:hypothetical protein
MTQAAEFGEAWGFIRDFGNRGISERDANDLHHICNVEFAPASKAHVKRIKRARPMITLTVKPREVADPARLAHNRIDQHLRLFKAIGRAQMILNRPAKLISAKPIPVVIAGLLPNYHVPCTIPAAPEPVVQHPALVQRLIHTFATVYGPLTRRQQAEAAFAGATAPDFIVSSTGEIQCV